MGNPVVPEGHGGERDAAAGEQAAESAMPVILPSEQVPGVPYPLLDGFSPTVGWQFRPPAKGGPAFVILRRGGLGSLKVTESFPLTADGWAGAWRSLVSQNPAAARQVLATLRAREADAARLRTPAAESDSGEALELDVRSLVSLREVAYLGGYAPGAALTAGQRYDVRFFEDRLAVFACHRAQALAEAPYSQVEDVEIGGPGLVKNGGGFSGGGFGLGAALEGMAIAAALNALTTRTSVKTVVRIQATGCELFLLHTRLAPEELRIQMSPPLAAIRSARAAAAQGGARAGSPSPVEELDKLAGMLERGLLTREEFDLMKAKILDTPTA